MAKQLSKNKRKFIYWFIPILATVIIAIAKIFYKSDEPSIDNSSTTIYKPKIENKNNGDVVSGDKITNTYNLPSKGKINPIIPKPKILKSLPPITNNGNLNINQQGGTNNQYNFIVPELPDRLLNQADIDSIKSIMKPDFKINFRLITSQSEETQAYGLQLLGYLQKNYKVINSEMAIFSSENKQRGQKRFYTRVDEGQKTVDILVQTQQ